jgi:putative restriction endonuclease
VTIPEGGPYADAVEGDVLHYAYRGTDPGHPDNVGLREAMRDRVPLVLFVRVAENRYLVRLPVLIAGDSQAALRFEVDLQPTGAELGLRAGEYPEIERRYVVASFRRRVHQRTFREQVLAAYRGQCALCRLRHQELLDAAHIIADSEDQGDPVVSNGLALCKLHHAAFDSFFLTVRPDYIVEVRPSILAETDGPMLVVGLQKLHGQRIELPRSPGDRPDVARLESRYERFLRAS